MLFAGLSLSDNYPEMHFWYAIHPLKSINKVGLCIKFLIWERLHLAFMFDDPFICFFVNYCQKILLKHALYLFTLQFFLQYITMKTQKVSVLLKKRFTTPNWIKVRGFCNLMYYSYLTVLSLQ